MKYGYLNRIRACKGKIMRAFHTRKGYAVIWVAFLVLFLTGMAGLSIDWAYVTLTKSQLQAAADAAALAGVAKLSQGQTVVNITAVNIASLNKAAKSPVAVAAGVDVLVGQFNTSTMQFTVTATSPNAVKVVARRTSGSPGGPLPLLFGPAFGVTTAGASAQAIAMVQNGSGSTGMLILSPGASGAMSMVGNASVLIQGGDVQVNSNNSKAVTTTGNALITASNVNIVGGDSFSGHSGTNSPLHTGVGSMADPLANVPPPTVTNNLGGVSLSGNQSKTISPGYYPNGISVNGNGNLTLNPGVYNLGGNGLSITGNGQLTANGVMLYLSGSGALNLTGNGAVVLTPPSATAYPQYAGISVFQDRADTAADSIKGNGNMSVDGAIYLPSAPATLNGNGGTLGAQLIANTLSITGNGSVTINFANGTKPQLPSRPALVQ
jgi:Flp pilus assembly protein TadG